MALTKSTMLSLGSPAPEFSLPDVVSGKNISLDDFSAVKGYLIVFMCQHCPYVKHQEEEIAKIAKDYAHKGIATIAISANDINTHPGDAPEELRKQAERLEFDFPYLFDETQEVAKAYTAACTPDFFLFDKDKKLVYRGQMDDSRPGNDIPVTGNDLRGAVENFLAGKDISKDQKPSMGCNIKWKPGNEPEYYL